MIIHQHPLTFGQENTWEIQGNHLASEGISSSTLDIKIMSDISDFYLCQNRKCKESSAKKDTLTGVENM